MGRTHCIFISQQENFFKHVNRYAERSLRLDRLLVRHKLVTFPSIVKYSDKHNFKECIYLIHRQCLYNLFENVIDN